MKQKFVISLNLIFSILVGCKTSNISELNKRINTANKLSIEKSPFESANSIGLELKRQLEFRDEYTNKLTELRKKYPHNPIILTESYSYVCLGCIADYVSIFTDGMLYQYTYDINQKKYIEKSKQISLKDLTFEGGAYDDIKEIYDSVVANKNWNKNPKKYGNDNCFDGSQTFYTIYNTDNKIESMHMRCWTPTKFRTE